MEDSGSNASSSPLSSVPTSPLSELSRSPSPPSEDGSSDVMPGSYPSPSSSQESSQTGSPCPDAMASGARQEGPPLKKRKTADPKARQCELLELDSGRPVDEQKPQLEKLLKVLHKRRKIVVIAGAGMSVSAGIPDFRSSTGLFKSLKSEHNLKSSGKDLFDASVYKDDDSTATFHDMVRKMALATKSACPTAFHHMLATLAQEGRLLRLYSQNVDGIDTSLPPLATNVPLRKADGAWPKTVQLHGGLEKMVCVKCHTLSDFEAELFDGPVPPHCRVCEAQDNVRTEHAGKRSHGIGRLRPRMVLYNEHNPDDEAIGLVARADLRTRPDAIIVVGTTLKVPGVRRIAREMCKAVRDRRDGLAVWINNDSPPPDKQLEWDLIVQGPCDEVARHAAMRKWDEEESFHQATDEELAKARECQAAVVITSPMRPKALELVGIPTPVASPKFAVNNDKVTLKLKHTGGPAKSNTSSFFSTTNGARPGLLRKDGKPRAKPGPKKGWRKNGVIVKGESANSKINQLYKVSKGITDTDKKPGVPIGPSVPDMQAMASALSRSASQATQEEAVMPADRDTVTRWSPQTPNKARLTMAPISLSEARMNAVLPFTPAQPIFSPLSANRSRSLCATDTDDHQSPTQGTKRRWSDPHNRETISPRGRVPKGLENMID